MDNTVKPVADAPKPGDTEKKADKALSKAQASAQPLLFQVETGLDKNGVVNTFRLGKKWADRVAIGDKVKLELIQDERNRELAEVEVTGVVTGNWDEVSGLAGDNHLVAHFPPAEAHDMLYHELKRIYGGEFTKRSLLTVLYFKIDK